MESGELLSDNPRELDGGGLTKFESSSTRCMDDDDHPIVSKTNEETSELARKSSDLNYDTPDGSIKGSKRDRSHSNSKASSSGTESPRPRLSNVKLSSVLVQPKEHRPEINANEIKRKAVLESQRNDKQAFDRNKRMFGMLMGTLQQFKTEEYDRERLTIKRSKIEEKLEMADREERIITTTTANTVTKVSERLRSEDESLKGEELSDKADFKLDIINRFKKWESTHRSFYNFIQTEAKPKIFWLPKEHTPTTEKKLRETKDYFSLCIAERAAKLKKELGDLDINFRDG